MEPSVGAVPSLIQESSARRRRTVIIKASSLLPFLKWEKQLLEEIGGRKDGARGECCGIQCVPACPQPLVPEISCCAG